MRRRRFLQYSMLTPLAGLLPRLTLAAEAPLEPTSFVLVHGSWSGAFAFEPVVPHLLNAGHLAIARDLPGHGLHIRFPKSYFQRPLNQKAFAKEISPLKNISFDDQVRSIRETVTDLFEKRKSGPVVLVAHSSGGLLISAVAEAIPEKIKQLIYISATIPPPGATGQECFQWPEAKKCRIGEILFKSDFKAIGALRMDPRTSDSKMLRLTKEILYPDASEDLFRAILNMQGPDTPLSTHSTPVNLTKERWGRIPRTYICCLNDDVVPLEFQHKMIEKADSLTPENRTQVFSISSSHTVSLVKPKELADLLLKSVHGDQP